MNCEIIKDLLPLYADGICSAKSAKAVEEHISECEACRRELSEMGATLPEKTDESAVKTITEGLRGKIGLLKASVLQSACMLASFLLIVYGVYVESSIPTGLTNGIMAFWVVVPATGFLISLINWHFVRFYKSLRAFVLWTALLTVGITLCLGVWAVAHYELFPAYFASLDAVARLFRLFFARGTVLTVILTLVSAAASYFYAKLTGKE